MRLTTAAQKLLNYVDATSCAALHPDLCNLIEGMRLAMEYQDVDSIHVVVTDRDSDVPSTKGGSIVFETNCNGATLEFANQKAAQLCDRYGEARVARLEFVGTPFVRQTQKEAQ